MNCPVCTNQARKISQFYFLPSFLKFKCQYCNTMLRGNAVMILLDLLTIILGIPLAVYAFYVVYTLTVQKLDPFFLLVSFLIALIVIAVFFGRLKATLGRYNRL